MIGPLTLSLLGIVAVSAGIERLLRIRDRKQFPAPDRHQDVGGHRLHYRLRGGSDLSDSGSTIVVFEADGADGQPTGVRSPTRSPATRPC